MIREFDWETPLDLLRQAYQLLQGAPQSEDGFGAYVDVGGGLEALEQILEDVEGEATRAGR